MNLQFALGETILDKSEVSSLLSATGQAPVFHIDIAKHIDVKTIDAQKLFSLSVEKRDPALAALASKLAINGFKAKRNYRHTEKQKIIKTLVDPVNADVLLEKLATDNCLKSLGAAMIIDSLYSADSVMTLREIATMQVNKLARDNRVSRNSDLFRGFSETNFYVWEPVTSTKVNRSERYHASPTYTSLRDGLAYLTKVGAVEVEETTSFGGRNVDSPSASVLQRKVYEIKLTEEGGKLANMWGDVETYIVQSWNKRVLDKLAA